MRLSGSCLFENWRRTKKNALNSQTNPTWEQETIEHPKQRKSDETMKNPPPNLQCTETIEGTKRSAVVSTSSITNDYKQHKIFIKCSVLKVRCQLLSTFSSTSNTPLSHLISFRSRSPNGEHFKLDENRLWVSSRWLDDDDNCGCDDDNSDGHVAALLESCCCQVYSRNVKNFATKVIITLLFLSLSIALFLCVCYCGVYVRFSRLCVFLNIKFCEFIIRAHTEMWLTIVLGWLFQCETSWQRFEVNF